jgi:WD40 repeat protein
MIQTNYEYFICFRGDAGMGGAIAGKVYDTLSNVFSKKVFFSSTPNREKTENYRNDETKALSEIKEFIIILTENFLSKIDQPDDEVRYELTTAAKRNDVIFRIVEHVPHVFQADKLPVLREIVGEDAFEKIKRAEYIKYYGYMDYERATEPQMCKLLHLDDRKLRIARELDVALLNDLNDKLNARRKHSGSYYLGEITKELFPSLGEIERTIEHKSGESDSPSLFTLLTEHHGIDYIMLGDGGIGKTVLFMETCAALLQRNVPALYLPLHELHEKSIKESILFANESLKNAFWNAPYLVLLLDGFNEVAETHKGALLQEIDLLAKLANVQVIMSSRFDPRQFDLSFVGFDIIQLEPLSRRQIENYLNACQLPAPENDDAFPILSYPLMLTLYTNATAYKNLHGLHRALNWRDNPSTASAIVWNFMQTQLQKCAFTIGNRKHLPEYVFILEYVIPYVAYKMVNDEIFEIEKRQLRNTIGAYVDVCRKRWNGALPERFDDLFMDYQDAEPLAYDTGRAWRILTQELHMMHPNANGNYTFFHQHFRDSLAAIHVINQSITEQDVPQELQNWLPQNVLKPISELISQQEIDSLVNKLRHKKLEARNFSLTNVLGVYEFLHGKDLRKFDFSGIDLRNISLRDYNVSGARFNEADVAAKTFLQQGHKGSIYSVALTPDERYFISASYDNMILVWETLSASFQSLLSGHSNAVTDLAVPDNETVYSVSADKTLRQWNLLSGEEKTLYTHSCGLEKLIFCNGNLYFIDAERNAFRRDCLTGNTEKIFSDASAICASHDGETIALFGADGTLALFNTFSLNVTETINVGKTVSCAAFMQEDVGLFCGCPNGEVFRFHTENRQIHPIGKHSKKVCDLRLYGDKILITASEDRSIGFWDFANARLLNVLEKHYRAVYAISATKRNKLLISGSDDNTIRIWNTESGALLKTIEGFTDWVNGIATAENQDLLMTVSGDTSVRLWRKSDFSWLYTLEGHTDWVYACALSANGEIAVSCACDKKVIVWNLREQKPENEFTAHDGEVKNVSLTADGAVCASAGADGSVFVFRTEGTLLARFQENGAVYGVAISRNAEKIAYCTETGKLIVRNLSSDKRFICIERAHDDKIHCLAANQEFTRIVTGSDDASVKLWNPETGECLAELPAFNSKVRCVAFSPDGKRFAAGSLDGEIKVWDVSSNEIVYREKRHFGEVRTLHFPDNNTLTSGGSDSFIYVYPLDGSEVRKIKPVPLMPVKGCKFRNAKFTEEYLKDAVRNNGGIL